MRPLHLTAWGLAAGLVSISAVLLPGARAAGADAAGGDSAVTRPSALDAATGVPKATLGPEYVDGSFGLGFRPLAGARMDRRKRVVENRLQLAQFVRLDIAWSLAFRLWNSERPIDVTAAAEGLAFDLAVQYPDAEVTRAEAVQVDAREAVRLAAAFSADGQRWLRQQVVVRMRSTEYIVLLLVVPADDAELGVKAFEEIVRSFRVLRTEVQQQQIDAAIERGVALKARIAEAGRLTDLAQEPVLMRLSREGQPVGLVEVREKPDKIGGKAGIRSLQDAWIFNPDESVQFVSEERFVAADLSYDEWRSLSQLMPSRQADPKQRLIVQMEAGIRRGDQLIVKYAGTGVDEKQNEKAIEVEPSYAFGAWPLLLPRLVDLNKPELYAFSMYDSERRGLVLRTFRVTGPGAAMFSGRRTSAFLIEDSEGLLPPINEIAVDAKGGILRLSSGPVEMVVSTQQQLDAEFGERIRATRKQFRENAGLPELSAQPEAAPKAPAEPAPARGRQRRR